MPPRAPTFPVGTPESEGPAIYIATSALARIKAHSAETLTYEVGGLLLGEGGSDEAGRPTAVVNHVLPVRSSDSSGTHFSFGGQGLKDAYDQIDEHFPDAKIVGWYHSHPRMSVFMSGTDLNSHGSLWRKAWQIAIVVEPASDQIGFFGWDGGEIRRLAGASQFADGPDHTTAWQPITWPLPRERYEPLDQRGRTAPPGSRGLAGPLGFAAGVACGIAMTLVAVGVLNGDTATPEQTQSAPESATAAVTPAAPPTETTPPANEGIAEEQPPSPAPTASPTDTPAEGPESGLARCAPVDGGQCPSIRLRQDGEDVLPGGDGVTVVGSGDLEICPAHPSPEDVDSWVLRVNGNKYPEFRADKGCHVISVGSQRSQEWAADVMFEPDQGMAHVRFSVSRAERGKAPHDPSTQ
ncbi:MAG: Mov34/MPN/PAD-1 family protein [Dehalococcoidia bacterium]